MTKPIKTLQDALTYQLQGLLQAERKIAEAFTRFSDQISSAEVKELVQGYVTNTDNVACKLDRSFNYLMMEPVVRKNEVVNKMIDETEYLLAYTAPPYLKDIVMIGCLENINAYKASAIQTAYLMMEPVVRKNEVVNKIIDETEYLLAYTAPPYLKDIVMIGCLENINAYKASAIQTAYLMAVELELDTVADLLQQILRWEMVTCKELTDLSIHEFNKLNDSANIRGDWQ
jgi:ferritin-like metal-binding protein YciE